MTTLTAVKSLVDVGCGDDVNETIKGNSEESVEGVLRQRRHAL